jgi:DNA ligase D-like protein (predicted ligase)
MAALKPPAKQRPRRTDSESTRFAVPAFRPPQLATLQAKVPSGDSWLFEMKYDGYRMQAAIAGAQVRLFTRNGHDWTKQFGYVVPDLAKLTKGSLLLDGELCAISPEGRTDFTLLKNSLDGKTPVVFYAFDLLEQDGDDLARLPQLERKERLEKVLSGLPTGSPVQYSQHVVVAKSPTARYYGGDRSTAWLKVKCIKRQEFVVIGWRPPNYGDVDVRGLFLGTYEDGQLVYRGGVGSGLSDSERIHLREVLGLIETFQRPAIRGMPRPEMRVARWVEPRLLAEVQYTEITPDGLVRHPSFKGIREDKPATDVRLEEA